VSEREHERAEQRREGERWEGLEPWKWQTRDSRGHPSSSPGEDSSLRGRFGPGDCRDPDERDCFVICSLLASRPSWSPPLFLLRALVSLFQRPDAHPQQAALFAHDFLSERRPGSA